MSNNNGYINTGNQNIMLSRGKNQHFNDDFLDLIINSFPIFYRNLLVCELVH